MTKHYLIVTAATLLLMSPSPSMAQTKAPSPCKGLEQQQCSEVAGCRWQAQRVAGEPSKSGAAYKRNVKAHCRKAPARRSSAAKQDA